MELKTFPLNPDGSVPESQIITTPEELFQALEGVKGFVKAGWKPELMGRYWKGYRLIVYNDLLDQPLYLCLDITDAVVELAFLNPKDVEGYHAEVADLLDRFYTTVKAGIEARLEIEPENPVN